MKKSLLTFSILIALSLAIYPITASAAGLVPCGGEGEEICNLCFLVVGFHNLTTFFLKILVVMSLAGIAIAGLMYVISAGSEKMITQAKSFLKSSVIGFAVVLCAWLIVTITMWALSAKTAQDPDGTLGIKIKSWNEFECSGVTNFVPTPAPNPAPEPEPTPDPTPTPTGSVEVLPVAIDFGSMAINMESSEKIVTVRNSSTADVSVSSVQISNADGKNTFNIKTDNCKGQTLKTGESCTIKTVYVSTGGAEGTDTMKIVTSAKEFEVELKGDAIKCELIAGNENAEFVFVLQGAEFDSISGGMKKDNCKINEEEKCCSNAQNWDFTKQADSEAFRSMTNDMSNGLNSIDTASQSYFAIYRVDEVYDGSNLSQIMNTIKNDCPKALPGGNVKETYYGNVYNGQGLSQGGVGSAYAHMYSTTNKAYYCAKNDPTADKIFAHEELGHVFARLRDEYYPTGNCSKLPWSNVTKDEACEKWKGISPPPKNCWDVCGCEAEKAICHRSTENSMMNTQWKPGGDFSPLQKYIINKCVADFDNCPPASLIEK